jgi:integrase
MGGSLGKLLLLTGQRRKEVAQMTEVEIEGALWRLPASRVKNGRAHVVPLTDAVLAVLAATPRFKSRPGYIFTTTGTSTVSGFDKGRKHLAAMMLQIADKERGELVTIEGWTFHDLRRTTATGMARIGIPVRVAEAVLNHVSGTGGGIVSVYQRHNFADEKQAALEAWSRMVLDLVEGSQGSVVQFGRQE